MGNCVHKAAESSVRDVAGGGLVEEMVKVITSNGGVMELYAPITAACITDEFPGHALFLSPKPLSPPLLNHHRLRPGQYYYLLPLHNTTPFQDQDSKTTPYRMSAATAADGNSSFIGLRKASETAFFDNLPRRRPGNAAAGEVWKVILVISPDQLSDILSHEARTQALIDSVRAVAKCSAVAPPLDRYQRCWSGKGNYS